jgi:hypothetical protein
VLIALGLWVQWLVERRRGHAKPVTWPRLLAMLAPIAGLLCAQALIAHQVGNAAKGVTAHEEYFRAWTWPWLPVVLDGWDVVTGRLLNMIVLLNLGTVLLAIYLLWKYWRVQPLAYSVMLLGLLLMQLAYGHYSLPRTQSSLRLFSTMTPFLQPLANEVAEVRWTPLSRVLAGLIVLSTLAFSAYMFGEKQFLG